MTLNELVQLIKSDFIEIATATKNFIVGTNQTEESKSTPTELDQKTGQKADAPPDTKSSVSTHAKFLLRTGSTESIKARIAEREAKQLPDVHGKLFKAPVTEVKEEPTPVVKRPGPEKK